MINDVPCPHINDVTNTVYRYKSTDVFQDEYLDTVMIKRLPLIYHRCRHFCPSSILPLSIAAALWCHCCKLKTNPHRVHYHDVTVECSGRKSRGNVQSCEDYWVCLGPRGVDFFKSHDVERVQDPGGVFKMLGKLNRGEGGMMGYIYSSSCDFLVEHVLLVKEHKMAHPSSC
jgi:hypothetical protein